MISSAHFLAWKDYVLHLVIYDPHNLLGWTVPNCRNKHRIERVREPSTLVMIALVLIARICERQDADRDAHPFHQRHLPF